MVRRPSPHSIARSHLASHCVLSLAGGLSVGNRLFLWCSVNLRLCRRKPFLHRFAMRIFMKSCLPIGLGRVYRPRVVSLRSSSVRHLPWRPRAMQANDPFAVCSCVLESRNRGVMYSHGVDVCGSSRCGRARLLRLYDLRRGSTSSRRRILQSERR